MPSEDSFSLGQGRMGQSYRPALNATRLVKALSWGGPAFGLRELVRRMRGEELLLFPCNSHAAGLAATRPKTVIWDACQGAVLGIVIPGPSIAYDVNRVLASLIKIRFDSAEISAEERVSSANEFYERNMVLDCPDLFCPVYVYPS